MNTLRTAGFLTIFFLIFPPHGTADTAQFMKRCGILWKTFIRDPELFQGYSREAVQYAVENFAPEWKKNSSSPELSAWGNQSEAAVNWLQSLDPKTIKTLRSSELYKNHDWGNTLYLVQSHEFGAVIKKQQRRTSFEGSKTLAITNNVKYEVLAYKLDQYLEFKMVLPVKKIDARSVAILYVPKSRNASFAGLGREPKTLKNLSLTHYLDVMMQNNDRQEVDNMLLTKEGREIAIDFDLSSLNHRNVGYTTLIDFVVQKSLITGQDGRKVSRPMHGIISRLHLEKLKNLDENILNAIAKDGEINLSNDEVENILSGKQRILSSINRWIEIYGERLVIPY